MPSKSLLEDLFQFLVSFDFVVLNVSLEQLVIAQEDLLVKVRIDFALPVQRQSLQMFLLFQTVDAERFQIFGDLSEIELLRQFELRQGQRRFADPQGSDGFLKNVENAGTTSGSRRDLRCS